jgi:hypothetical protein
MFGALQTSPGAADMSFRPNETVYCRFTGEPLTVIACDGCVAVLRNAYGTYFSRIVGELTRRAPAVGAAA